MKCDSPGSRTDKGRFAKFAYPAVHGMRISPIAAGNRGKTTFSHRAARPDCRRRRSHFSARSPAALVPPATGRRPGLATAPPTRSATPTAGPGGGSSGPARPHAANVSAAAPSKASAKPARKTIKAASKPLVHISAKTNNPANPDDPNIADRSRAARFWRQHLARRVIRDRRALSLEPFEPAFGLRAHVFRRGAAIDACGF